MIQFVLEIVMKIMEFISSLFRKIIIYKIIIFASNLLLGLLVLFFKREKYEIY